MPERITGWVTMMVWLFNETNDFDLRNLIKNFLSTDSCTDIYRGVNIISNCVSAAWHFSLLCLITTWCSCRGNHNFTGRKGAWGLWHKGHTMLLRQFFIELFVVFGLPVLCMSLGSCTHYVYMPISLCGELASFSSSSLYSLQLAGPLGSHR